MFRVVAIFLLLFASFILFLAWNKGADVGWWLFGNLAFAAIAIIGALVKFVSDSRHRREEQSLSFRDRT